MSNSRKDKRTNKTKVKRSRKVGIILADIQLILTFIFLGLLIILDILPFKYLIVVILVLVFFLGYAFLSQLTKNFRTFGKVVSVISSIVLILGCYYLGETGNVLSKITGSDQKIDEMQVVVLEGDSAQTINDVIGYPFGINEVIDRKNSDEVINNINEELKTQLDINEYSGYDSLVDALYTRESHVIIINDASREIIREAYPNFDTETRILVNYDVVSAIPTPEANDTDLTQESFHVYISGTDTGGTIAKTGRSDVNIIATINPNTHKVLLTNTPRDYFIPFPNTHGQRDKLTHAGNYGVDISIGALEDLYDIDIDYYVRVNFDTLINLVDALGGVSVYSEYSFDAGGYSFNKGYNDMDGDKALVFSRERSSFGEGDIQRGRNQMEVIKGIIDKAISPSILLKYSDVMDSIAGSFETNMSDSAISGLIKMQLAETPSWDIESNHVTGTGASEVTYSQGRSADVLIPDDESVRDAKQKMNDILKGATIAQEY